MKDKLAYVVRRGDDIVAGMTSSCVSTVALLEFKFRPEKLEDGIEVCFEAFGNDEHRRWDQLAYTIPLMVECESGLELIERPSIDYSEPRGVRTVFRVPYQYQRSEQMAGALYQMTKWMTMGGKYNSMVLERLGNYFSINFSELSDSFLLDAPQLLNHLLYRTLEDGWKPKTGLRIAVQGLRFLIENGHKDYQRGDSYSLGGKDGTSSLNKAVLMR